MLAPQFEILPFPRGEEQASRLPEPVALTVTCSPRHGPDQAVEVGVRLCEMGHTVTVHIAARMVRDAAHADSLLSRMAQAGVTGAFVIGGDVREPVGAYDSALGLLEHLDGHPQRPDRVGVAAYPEGHPLIDGEILRASLKAKAELADYVTTQMCFDVDVLLEWLSTARADGLDLPVLIGLPGVVDRRRLVEVSMRIGVGPSLSFLRKQRGLRSLLSRGSSADRLFDALASRITEPELAVAGLHYFTFNQLLDTWEWDRRKRESWKLVVGS
jgi:methylenetetrahydrofolate reductase (NADPH)